MSSIMAYKNKVKDGRVKNFQNEKKRFKEILRNEIKNFE